MAGVFKTHTSPCLLHLLLHIISGYASGADVAEFLPVSHITMTSVNFHHVLSWKPLDQSPSNASYTVLVEGESGFEEVRLCGSPCELTDWLTLTSSRYHLRVCRTSSSLLSSSTSSSKSSSSSTLSPKSTPSSKSSSSSPLTSKSTSSSKSAPSSSTNSVTNSTSSTSTTSPCLRLAEETAQGEMELSFAPDEDTVLGPPTLTLTSADLCLSGPFIVGGRRSGVSVADVYNSPRYEVKYRTRDGEVEQRLLVTIRKSRFDFSPLWEPGGDYCVSARFSDRSYSKEGEWSPWACSSLAPTYGPLRAAVLVMVVMVMVVMGVMFYTVFRLHRYIHPHTRTLPKALASLIMGDSSTTTSTTSTTSTTTTTSHRHQEGAWSPVCQLLLSANTPDSEDHRQPPYPERSPYPQTRSIELAQNPSHPQTSTGERLGNSPRPETPKDSNAKPSCFPQTRRIELRQNSSRPETPKDITLHPAFYPEHSAGQETLRDNCKNGSSYPQTPSNELVQNFSCAESSLTSDPRPPGGGQHFLSHTGSDHCYGHVVLLGSDADANHRGKLRDPFFELLSSVRVQGWGYADSAVQ